MTTSNNTICLKIYSACVTKPVPQYIYLGQYFYDTYFDVFTLDNYFITINLPGFTGTYYTDGLCPVVSGDTCAECIFNPAGPLLPESVTIIAPTYGETCYGNDCVILENCENTSEQLFGSAMLVPYLGSVVKIVGSDKCWHVIPNGPCLGSEDYIVESVCETCIGCLPAEIVPTPKVEPEYFENFTQINDSQNEIATNVKFANAYWDLYKSLKHGIESNCNTVDIDQITIKKRACDINKLYDPEICTITVPPVDIPCDEPTGVPIPQTTKHIYKTLANTLCCDEPNCIDSCVDLSLKSKNGLYFNFTVDTAIELSQLPMTINYEGCCMKIDYIIEGFEESSSTFDFEGLLMFNTSDCSSCNP